MPYSFSVRFVYRPKYFIVGLLISLLTLTTLIVVRKKI